MALADLVVCHLTRAGTRAIFGVPGGGGNLDLIEASGRAGLPFVLTATETAGAIAAIAQGEITGAPGACLTTLGPGAASVANGVACALLERTPLLVFTDAQTSGDEFEHQQIDQSSLFAPITKWTGRLSPDSAAAVLPHAVAIATEAPSGPVHLDCVTKPANDRKEPPVKGTVPFTRSTSAIAADCAALLSRSRKPLIIAGLGARGVEDVAALRQFLERRNIPAMVTYKAKGVVPDRHRCFAGVFTNATIERPIVAASDLIIGVGLDPVELLPRPWAYSQPIVSIGRWPVSAGHVPFTTQHVTDIAAAITDVDACLSTSEWDLDEVGAQVRHQRRLLTVSHGALTGELAITVATHEIEAGVRVTVDAGAHMFPATMLWPVDEPNGMLISNGLSTMGFALPAAIGAALLDRDRPVVALTGDGGLLMCTGELLTAARERLRIVTVVFNDASLSLIEIKQQQKRYQPAGVALGSANWCAIAEGFGVAGFTAENESQLVNAIAEAVRVDGPSLIDVKIDRSSYGRTLTAIRG